MIIKKVDIKAEKRQAIYRFLQHRLPKDKTRRSELYAEIKEEVQKSRWKLIQEVVISDKVKVANKKAWEKLKKASIFFIKQLIHEKKADNDNTRIFVVKHVEKTVDGYYNIHFHITIFLKNHRNQRMLIDKNSMLKAMYETFLRFDPERAKSLEKYLKTGKSKGTAYTWQAQKEKQKITEKLNKFGIEGKLKENVAKQLLQEHYNIQPRRRKHRFPNLPLKLQKIQQRLRGAVSGININIKKKK